MVYPSNYLYFRISKSLVSVVLVGLISIFFYHIFKYNTGFPYANDDSFCFLYQFEEFFYSKDLTVKNTIDFLFLRINGPYPFFSGRVFSLFSYILFGEINFYFLKTLGNILYVISLLLLCLEINKEKLFVATLGLLLVLVPMINNFWTIPISTTPVHFISIILTLKFLEKEKYIAGSVSLFFVVFTSVLSPVLFFLSLFLIALNKQRNNSKGILIYISSFIFYSLVLYNYAIKDYTIVPRSTTSAESFMEYLAYFCSYVSNFSLQSIGRYIFVSDWGINFLYYGFFLFFISTLVFFIKRRLYNKNIKLIIIILYILAIGSAAAIGNGFSKNIVVDIPPRYEIFSVYFILSIIILLSNLLRISDIFKVRIGLLLFSIFLAGVFCKIKYDKNYYLFGSHVQQRNINSALRIMNENNSNKFESEWIRNSVSKKLFSLKNDNLFQGKIKRDLFLNNIEFTDKLQGVYLDDFTIDDNYIFIDWFLLRNFEMKGLISNEVVLYDDTKTKFAVVESQKLKILASNLNNGEAEKIEKLRKQIWVGKKSFFKFNIDENPGLKIGLYFEYPDHETILRLN